MQFVMMSVKCMGKQCEHCTNMDLLVTHYVGAATTDNVISCKNVKTCDLIYDMAKEELKNDHQD